jgi:hypothetical protein
MSTLSPHQLSHALRLTPKTKTSKTAPFAYDPDIYDAPLEGMFGRRWHDDLEVFPPRAKELWSALFAPTIGRTPCFEELPMLKAIAAKSRVPSLRNRAEGGLRDYLRDCSGNVDPSMKREVSDFLDRLKSQLKEAI